MPEKDKLDLSNRNFLDAVVDQRRLLVGFVIVITVYLSVFIPHMETDPTLKSGVDTTSAAYLQYEQFVEVFGNEEFILVAIQSDRDAPDNRLLTSLQAITLALENSDKIAEVISLSNLKLFQTKGELFGNYPVLTVNDGKPGFPDMTRWQTMKSALPITELLLSQDLKTVGVLIRIAEEWKFDTGAIKDLLADIDKVVKSNVPAGAEYHIIGAPLIRQAIVRYNIQTGIIFGILCMLIGTVVSVYVFKSAKVTAITNVILGVCVVWVLGLMSLFRIPLNSTTALSFGFIPIVTLEIVIHMVVRYHQFHQSVKEKIPAIKLAVRWLARPCAICSATTAVGFGTLMVSSIPMVQQLGFIMSIGIMISYCLAMILTPAFFSIMKSLDAPEPSGVLGDWADAVLEKVENAIFNHHRFFVGVGIAITVILFAGAPLIRSDPQILRMLSDSTPEVRNINFVEKKLAPVNSLEVMLVAEDSAFKKPATWKKVRELEERLKEIPEVVDSDSFLPLLEYLKNVVQGSKSTEKDLFADPALIPQLLVVTSLSSDGERLARRHLDSDYDRLHISVRIRNSPSVPIEKTIERIRATTDSVMKGVAKTMVTGDLAVVALQASELINDQIKSMFLAAAIITVLMMLQMGSPLLGVICLLPNIPPVAAVFGIMGWFGISLDSVTVFAATVAIGLAVDNTIHYLTQLKREIRLNPDQGMEECVRRAYRLTAKQIASWSIVTMFGFLALAVSPFRPVVFFGILGCSSILLGLYGDLIFMQSLILSSATIRNTIRKLIDKEIAAQS
ncbi:MAG: efflux RND transporter permease subunit [Desulfomonilaceae bacterium]